jgi:SAM-dependent methyltransferase
MNRFGRLAARKNCDDGFVGIGYDRAMRYEDFGWGKMFDRQNAVSNKRWIACLCGVVLLLAAGGALSTIGQAPATTPQQQRKTSTPYTGDLSIFDYPDRDQKLHINEVMELLGVSPGKSVADIGAGSGWFTVRAARRVAPLGTVYAVDVNPEAIQYVEERAKKEQLTNIRTVLDMADDPRLPVDSVNAVLLLKTYHEVAQPVALMKKLRSALRPGARVGIIDRKGNGENHGVDKKLVVQEVESAGYQLVEERDELVKDDKMDYFLIFVAK